MGRWDKPFKDPTAAMRFSEELNLKVSEASEKFIHDTLNHCQGKIDMKISCSTTQNYIKTKVKIRDISRQKFIDDDGLNDAE